MTYPSEVIEDQMARLKLLFRNDYAYLSVDIEKGPDNGVNYSFRAGVEYVQSKSFVLGSISLSVKIAVDNLLKELKITGVEQYIRTNLTYRCEMCGETYHYRSSVTKINSESSYTILNACDNCQMQAIHEIREQEELMAEQGLEGGTK